jgi:lysophospholipase L1-like esterase
VKVLCLHVVSTLLLLGTLSHAEIPSAQHRGVGEAWREAYQSSPAATDITTDAEFQAFAEKLKIPPNIAERVRPKHVSGTVRYSLVVSAGGPQLRLRISNEVGRTPLYLTAVSVGLAGTAFDAVPGSIKGVTFSGSRSVAIPPGAPMLSDPVNVRVASGAAVLVSLHGPEEFILTGNGGTALAVAPGDQTMAEQLNTWTPMSGRPIVTGISVLASAATSVVVAMGDSITDGNRSDRGALHSWPEQLSHRLTAKGGPIRYAVVNAGIAGNRLLQPGVVTEMGISALARLDRDVLRIDGLSHIVLLEGTNDIGMSGHTLFGDNPDLTVDDLVIGYRQIIARAHARHVKVIIATILPFGGSISHSSPDKEKLRQLINSWIRASGEPDGVVDFDAVMHDPADPSRMQMQFDSGDHLHPNEAGSRAMGDAIDLSLFR